MQPGQHFMAFSKYNGRLSRKYTPGKKGVYTVEFDEGDFVMCKEITGIPTSNGKDRHIQIFRSVFDIRTVN